MNPTLSPTDSSELLRQARLGDADARQQLLEQHRQRLRQMVAVRIDPRLSARVDPSDVVQEALADANAQLDNYLRDQPLPLYPWLRQFAWERLVDLHRRHVQAQKRSVAREERLGMSLSGGSCQVLADRLLSAETSPSVRLMRNELRDRVREALDQLPARDREVLVLRHLEELSTAEVAAVVGSTPGAVMTRHTRALGRLRRLLDTPAGGPP